MRPRWGTFHFHERSQVWSQKDMHDLAFNGVLRTNAATQIHEESNPGGRWFVSSAALCQWHNCHGFAYSFFSTQTIIDCRSAIRFRQKRDDDQDGPYFIPRRLPKGEPCPGHLPAKLWVIIQLLEHAFIMHRSFECADLFAGKCAVSKAYKRKGRKACVLDIELDPRDEPWCQRSVCVWVGWW